jgi:hypothetical protein
VLIIHDSAGRIATIISSQIPSGGGEIVTTTDPDVSSSTHYVDDGDLVERPGMAASLDGYVLTAPVGATWRLTEPALSLDETGAVGGDGEVEFEFDDPGTYSLLVTNFPDRDFTAEIEVE